MYDKDLMEAMNRRRQMGLSSQMEQPPLSDANTANPGKIAGMEQPMDVPQHLGIQHATGPGYETMPQNSLEEEGLPIAHNAMDGKESESELHKIYDSLGSGNAKGLRGRAMSEYEKKKEAK